MGLETEGGSEKQKLTQKDRETQKERQTRETIRLLIIIKRYPFFFTSQNLVIFKFRF